MPLIRRLVNLALISLLISASIMIYSVKANNSENSLLSILNNEGFTNIALTDTETFSQGTYSITLYAEFSNYYNQTELSYYTVNMSDFQILFAGPDGKNGSVHPPINKIFIAIDQFGLSILSPEPHRYFTETIRNPDYPEQHAKVYRNLDCLDMFLIGFEDGLGGGDRDYDDLVFSLLKLPPTFKVVNVTNFPEDPNYDETVKISAQVIRQEADVDSVILSYSTNLANWVNVNMSLEGGLYSAEIPPQPYNSTVSYKFYASDTAGNSIVSEIFNYTVGDFVGPLIFNVNRFPISPNFNQPVTVSANVTEPTEASGLKNVTLFYNTEGTWETAETVEDTDLYNWIIPAISYETTVFYVIYTRDNAGNWRLSDFFTYSLIDSSPPLVRIDKPSDGSYIAGEVELKVFVNDQNFDIAELRIENKLVIEWTSTGSHTFKWNTTAPEYPDGIYTIKLRAYDVVRNFLETAITVIVDNTSPLIGVPTRTPTKITPLENVRVSVWVSDNGGSGIKNVTLWYLTNGDWSSLEMAMADGLWTATIPPQSAGVNVKFFIDAFDNLENSAKTSTFSYTVTVTVPNSSPIARFNESAETASTGENIHFDASESSDPDGSILSHLWDFGDGNTAEGVEVDHAYENNGTYTVTLTVTDDDGATDSFTSTKNVLNRPPLASFTENATTVSPGEVIQFDASQSQDPDGTIVSYHWDFGDGNTTTGVTPTHTYKEDGNYTVTLTVTDDDGVSSSESAMKIVKTEEEILPLVVFVYIGIVVTGLILTLLYGLFRRRKKKR